MSYSIDFSDNPQLQKIAEKHRLSVDEAKQLISNEQIKSLEILSFFFLQIGQVDSALRTVKAIQVFEPSNPFTVHMQVLCADALGQFDIVTDLTDKLLNENLDAYKAHPDLYKALLLLRLRALNKLERSDEAKDCLTKLEQL